MLCQAAPWALHPASPANPGRPRLPAPPLPCVAARLSLLLLLRPCLPPRPTPSAQIAPLLAPDVPPALRRLQMPSTSPTALIADRLATLDKDAFTKDLNETDFSGLGFYPDYDDEEDDEPSYGLVELNHSSAKKLVEYVRNISTRPDATGAARLLETLTFNARRTLVVKYQLFDVVRKIIFKSLKINPAIAGALLGALENFNETTHDDEAYREKILELWSDYYQIVVLAHSGRRTHIPACDHPELARCVLLRLLSCPRQTRRQV